MSLAADEDMSVPLHHWQSLLDHPADDVLHVGTLYSLATSFNHWSIIKRLNITEPDSCAAAAYSGDWLHAVPISECGLRLDDEAIRLTVGLKLASEVCQP